MSKLKAHGIDGRVADWISDWLDNRMQRVCINGALSGWRLVTSGVPQGSVLGPLLFLIFINDLDLELLSSILKFADDTKIYGKAATPADRLQLQLDPVVKVDRRIRWHYTTTILRLRIGALLTRYRNCKFHNGCRTISRHVR